MRQDTSKIQPTNSDQGYVTIAVSLENMQHNAKQAQKMKLLEDIEAQKVEKIELTNKKKQLTRSLLGNENQENPCNKQQKQQCAIF